MSQSLKYVGTVSPWWETATTGRPQVWRSGQVGDVPNADADELLATGLFVHARTQAVETPAAFAHVGPWALLPAAAREPLALAAVTDLGPSPFVMVRSDGVRWRPVHPVPLVSFYSAAGVSIAAGGSETALGTERRLPAGVVQPGDLLQFSAWATSSPTDANTRVLAVRQGASSGFVLNTGQRLARFASVSTANNDVAVCKQGIVVAATTVQFPGTSEAGAYAGTTNLAQETVLDFDAESYLQCAATPTAGTAWVVHGIALTLMPAA